MRFCNHNSVASRISSVAVLAAIAGMWGCASDSSPGASDHYVESPLGYVPPPEVTERLPIQSGPVQIPQERAQPIVVIEGPLHPAIELAIDEDGLHPGDIVARPGQNVRLAVVNRSSRSHDLQVTLPERNADLRGLLPGEARMLEFTAPRTAGVYIFTCPAHEHDSDAPLQGRLIVQGDSE